MGNIKITEWLWTLYPILVALFMIVSLSYLMGSGPESVLGVISKQNDNTQEEKVLAQMKAKLVVLQGIDRESETNNLKSLLAAVPPAKKIWFLLEAVNISSSDSGMVITEYGGTVGDVKEASESATISAQLTNTSGSKIMSLKVNYQPTAFENVARLVGEIESYLPLIKVSKVSYDSSKVTLDLEGAWGPYFIPGKNVYAPLPENYREQVTKALDDISRMRDLTAGDI